MAYDHHELKCGTPEDFTVPLGFHDQARIMALAVFYQRVTGYSWSLTHRPTAIFWNCFPILPLPSPEDASDYLAALQEQIKSGISRFAKDHPDETAVVERIRTLPECLLGWQDLGSEETSSDDDDDEGDRSREPSGEERTQTTEAPKLPSGAAKSSNPKALEVQPEDIAPPKPSSSKRQEPRTQIEAPKVGKHIPFQRLEDTYG